MTHTDALLMLAIIAASLLIAWAIEHLLQRRDYHRSLDALAAHGLFLPEDDARWRDYEAEFAALGIAPMPDDQAAAKAEHLRGLIEINTALRFEQATEEELNRLIEEAR